MTAWGVSASSGGQCIIGGSVHHRGVSASSGGQCIIGGSVHHRGVSASSGGQCIIGGSSHHRGGPSPSPSWAHDGDDATGGDGDCAAPLVREGRDRFPDLRPARSLMRGCGAGAGAAPGPGPPIRSGRPVRALPSEAGAGPGGAGAWDSARIRHDRAAVGPGWMDWGRNRATPPRSSPGASQTVRGGSGAYAGIRGSLAGTKYVVPKFWADCNPDILWEGSPCADRLGLSAPPGMQGLQSGN